jgi:hypothetical protein
MISRVALQHLPMAMEFLKIAELPEPPPDFGEVPQEEVRHPVAEPQQKEIKSPILHALKAVALPAAAFGTGTALGYLGQRGVEKALKMGPSDAPVWRRAALPVLGGAFGLAMQQYKSRENKELHDAVEAHNRQSARRVPA